MFWHTEAYFKFYVYYYIYPSQIDSSNSYIKKLALFLRKKINIVPLFESAYTLEKSVDIIERCIREGIYQDKQIEIMLAYSDTNKRNGLFDSVFQLYFTQIKLTEMAKKYDKEINFFHGIGGSPPRGGSSYEDFIFSFLRL